MDNLTHTLTALALSQAGFNRKTRFATLALVIGSNLPDVDVIARARGSLAYLRYHRGITHSMLGISLLAVALALLVYFLARKKPPRESKPPLNGGWLFAACWVGTASHLLLDLTNSYGVRPFLPFSGRWHAWDIMFIIDPILWGLLVAGLVIPLIFRLISEEVGATKPAYRGGAILALCGLVLLWGLRGFSHRRAMSMLAEVSYQRQDPLRFGAFPSPANPFAWTGVVETDSAFHVLRVNALEDNLDPAAARIYHKAEPSPALDAAMKTSAARIFLDFARFPWSRVEPSEQGFTVTFQDLRFASSVSGRPGFVARIELEQDLRPRSESFSFSPPAREGGF